MSESQTNRQESSANSNSSNKNGNNSSHYSYDIASDFSTTPPFFIPNEEPKIYTKYLKVLYDNDPTGQKWQDPTHVWKETKYNIFNADILTLVINRMISIGVQQGDLMWDDAEGWRVMITTQGIIRAKAMSEKQKEDDIKYDKQEQRHHQPVEKEKEREESHHSPDQLEERIVAGTEAKASLEKDKDTEKEKEVGLKDLLIGSSMIAGVIPTLLEGSKLEPHLTEYKLISKHLTLHYQRILRELGKDDDGDLLLRYIEKGAVCEEALELHLALEQIYIKGISLIHARKNMMR